MHTASPRPIPSGKLPLLAPFAGEDGSKFYYNEYSPCDCSMWKVMHLQDRWQGIFNAYAVSPQSLDMIGQLRMLAKICKEIHVL